MSTDGSIRNRRALAARLLGIASGAGVFNPEGFEALYARPAWPGVS